MAYGSPNIIFSFYPTATLFKQAIAQGNSEGARIYAQDAIREKNQVSAYDDNHPY